MVFRPFPKPKQTLELEIERESESETETSSLMAAAPVKSQPLHNFSLPHLKWGKNQTSNQRCRKPNESSRDSPSLDHQHYSRSSASEADSDGGSSQKDQETVNQKASLPPGSARTAAKNHRFPLVSSCSSASFMVKMESSTGRGEEVRSSSSNLVIRIPKGESVSKNKSGDGAETGGGEVGETEEPAAKPWNLRPRRSIMKMSNDNGGGGGGTRNGEMEEKQHENHHQPKSLRLRGFVESENVEKKEKLRFSIPLSREDIEVDFFMMTGSKPPRRSKKRNRTVQKQLDNVFPGLWLAGITADSYSVPEVPSKKDKI